MGNALVRARLRKVWVRDNGDKDTSKPPRSKEELRKVIKDLREDLLKPGLSNAVRRRRREEYAIAHDELMAWDEDNVVEATLFFPRSGESSITALHTLRLVNGKAPDGDYGEDPDFFKSVLFKEEIQGETELMVKVLDKDPTNPVLRFLRGLAVTLFDKISGGLLQGVTHVFPASAGTEVSSLVKSSIKPDDDKEKTHLVAESAKVLLEIEGDGSLMVTGPKDRVQFEDGKLTLKMKAARDLDKVQKGDDNGEVILLLASERI